MKTNHKNLKIENFEKKKKNIWRYNGIKVASH